MIKTKTFYIIICSAFLFLVGCTEPYEIETVDYENVLVVESTITNELKPQIVKLSRTSTLENPQILLENYATVTVRGDNGENFSFSQDSETGFYVSNQAFSAQPNVSYSLNIKTQDGKTYSSSPVILPPAVEIDEVYGERIVNNEDNKDGVQVLVNTEDPTGNAKYFRYEYEETYKIVAPYPSPYTAEIINFDDEWYTYEVILSPREPEIICYTTENSTGINQTATTEFNENRVFRFPVKYLSKFDAKMQTRYSILVKQYVQSLEAYTFYKIVKELGNVESLLSQGQPGYVAGNMVSDTNSDEKVLGFFEASSMTSKRIYFNYDDFGLEKPPYFVDCDYLILDYRDNSTLDNDPNDREIIFTYLSYFDYQVVDFQPPFVYIIAKAECTVCTSFSSKVRPNFWED
jgi:hypothetical protein